MAPLGGNIYLSFQGVGFSSGYRRSFDVMCGDNPPKPVSSTNWTTVKLPLQTGLTIFSDRSPASMVVEMRFGRWDSSRGWQTDDAHSRPTHRHDGTGNTEDDIDSLEWMAGSNFGSGPSPAVYVWSHSSSGGDTFLIPPQYQGVPWVINGGIEWGTIWRNPNGYRTRADATITLLHYLNLKAPPRPDTSVQGGYFQSQPGRDTALLIASAPTSHSPLVDHRLLATRILAASQNNPCKGTSINLKRRSVSWPIRHGVPVFVPTHQSS